MIKLIEPQWWVALLQALHAWMMASPQLIIWIPRLADLFVFSYPIFLIAVYAIGRIKKNVYYKKAALRVFFATIISVVVNVFIQFFVDKVRPNFVLNLLDQKTETILHRFLPSSSFPSDHAALSMGLAIAVLMRGIQKKDRLFVWFGVLFIVCSLVMSFSRITIAVHWPTDVIGWSLLGIVIVLILSNKKIYKLIDRFSGWIGKYI